jgi:hypothetical protein
MLKRSIFTSEPKKTLNTFEIMKRAKLSFLTVTLCLLYTGCASNQFQTAKSSKSLEAYNSFINKYSKSNDKDISRYVDAISRLRDSYLWERAKSQNTLEGYESYLGNIDSTKTEEAKYAYDELILKKSMAGVSSHAEYKANCKLCPDKHVDLVINQTCKKYLSDFKSNLSSKPSSWYDKVQNICTQSKDPGILAKAKVAFIYSQPDESVPQSMRVLCEEDQSLKSLPQKTGDILVKRLNLAVSNTIDKIEHLSNLDTYLKRFGKCLVVTDSSLIQTKFNVILEQFEKRLSDNKIDPEVMIDNFDEFDVGQYCNNQLTENNLACPLSSYPQITSMNLEIKNYDNICTQLNKKQDKCVKKISGIKTKKRGKYLKSLKRDIKNLIRKKEFSEAKGQLQQRKKSFTTVPNLFDKLGAKIAQAEILEEKREKARREAEERREERRRAAEERREERRRAAAARREERAERNWERKNRRYIKMCRCWRDKFQNGYGVEASARRCGSNNAGALYFLCKEIKRRGY